MAEGDVDAPPGKSICIFQIDSPVRALCLRIVSYKHFDNIMVPCIMLSSVCLALEDPHKDESTTFTERYSYYYCHYGEPHHLRCQPPGAFLQRSASRGGLEEV
eukprot:3083030-Pyramimonas_sp.AAC.2